jgi:hypothetical protein
LLKKLAELEAKNKKQESELKELKLNLWVRIINSCYK